MKEKIMKIKLENIMNRFIARVDLNNFGKVLSEEERQNHPDILWLKDKIKNLWTKKK